MDVGSFLKKFKETQQRGGSTLVSQNGVETGSVAPSCCLINAKGKIDARERKAYEFMGKVNVQLHSESEDDDSLSDHEAENGAHEEENDLMHVHHSSSKRMSRVAAYYASRNDNGTQKKDFAPLKAALTNQKSRTLRRGEFDNVGRIRENREMKRCRSLVEAKRYALGTSVVSATSARRKLKRAQEQDMDLPAQTLLPDHYLASHLSEISSTSHSFIAFDSASSPMTADGQVSIGEVLSGEGVEAELEALLGADKLASPVSVGSSPSSEPTLLEPSSRLENKDITPPLGTAAASASSSHYPSAVPASSPDTQGISAKGEMLVNTPELISIFPPPVGEKAPLVSAQPRAKKMSLFDKAKVIAKQINKPLNSKLETSGITRAKCVESPHVFPSLLLGEDSFLRYQKLVEGLRNVKVFIRHGLELVVVVFMEQYIVGKVIDEGQFGCIREAIIKESGMHVVLKIIRSSRAAEGLPHPVVREAVIAVNMSHPFVVRTFETFVEGSSMILVMERCYSTVAKLLAEHSPRCPIPRCLSRRLMYMLISGVQYVHQQNVLHRDVKPSNCLLTESFVLKLGDFGLSRPHKKGARMTHEVETRWYRAPELILGNQNYGEEIDIWSVGCVLAELARGYGGAIFQGVGDLGQLALVFDVLGTPDKDAVKWMPDWDKIHFMEKKGSGIKGILPQVHPLELDLITRILVLNPKKRPSATEILSHPCFSEYS